MHYSATTHSADKHKHVRDSFNAESHAPTTPPLPCHSSCQQQLAELESQQADAQSTIEALNADKGRLVPQLEELRWQGRQLERKLEDMRADKEAAAQVGGH